MSSKPEGSMLWGGRFTGGLDPLMVKYNESIYFDRVLYKQDILGSIAFARANAKAGIISQEEFEKIEEGLKAVQKEWETDKFEIVPGVDEYVGPVAATATSYTNCRILTHWLGTFTLPTSVDWARLSARTLLESFTLAAAAMSRSCATCACGCATSCARLRAT